MPLSIRSHRSGTASAFTIAALLAAVALSIPLWLGYTATPFAEPDSRYANNLDRQSNSPVPTPTPTPVFSRGREAHGAKAWHDAGIMGGGSNPIKVGIIDHGFSGLRSLMDKGELPSSDKINIRCYQPNVTPVIRVGNLSQHLNDLVHCDGHYWGVPPAIRPSRHGASVAQTVIDIAPEVELYIANPRSWQQLSETVDWMVEQGVQVINYSIGWNLEAPGNGDAHAISYHPLDTIDTAVRGRILWVNAIGNSRKQTWYGKYRDPNGDGRLDFSDSGSTLNTIKIAPLKTIDVYMRWEGIWSGSKCDLDLYLFGDDDLGIGKFTTSDPLAKGGASPINGVDTPYEILSYTAGKFPRSRYLSIVSDKKVVNGNLVDKCPASHRPSWIQIQVSGGDVPLYFTRDEGDIITRTERGKTTSKHVYSGSDYYQIGVPSESNNPGMLAVGAAHLNDLPIPTPTIADYSSRGPTIDGRKKPEIIGVSYEFVVLVGTDDGDVPRAVRGASYAAPHVAGLAALVLHRYKDAWGTKYTPADLANYLKATAAQQTDSLPADDPNKADPNNVWGHGFAMLPNPAPVASFTTAHSTITEGRSQSFTIANSSNVSSVKVVINNAGDTGKLAFGSSGAACPGSSGSLSGTRGKGIAFSLKGCSPGQVTVRLYKGDNILLRIHTVTVQAARTTTTTGPTVSISGLASSQVSGATDAFTVTLSNLTLRQPYTVTFATSHRSVGFDFSCTSYTPSVRFTPTVRRHIHSFTLYACQSPGGTVTAQLRRGNAQGAIVATAALAVTTTAATGSLSGVPAAITVGHDHTLTVNTNIPNSTGAWIAATISGDVGQLTLPPTRGCYHSVSGFQVFNGSTVTLRGCRAGQATLRLYHRYSGVKLAEYTVTVNNSNTSLSPTPGTFTIGTNQTFTLTTDLPNTPGLWIRVHQAGDAGRLVPAGQNCALTEAGIAAVNGNTLTLKPCAAGTTAITLHRSNSGVDLKTYTVTINAS